MPKMSPDEAVAKALAARKHSVPTTFAPDPSSPVAPSTQRAFAADLERDGPLWADDLAGHQVWLYRPALRGVRGRRRPYLDLGDFDGGNYRVFTWEFSDPNPTIHYCDATSEWDVENDEPRTGRRLGNLASFLKALQPKIEKAEKVPSPEAATPRRLECDVGLDGGSFPRPTALQRTEEGAFAISSAAKVLVFDVDGSVLHQVDADGTSRRLKILRCGPSLFLTEETGSILSPTVTARRWNAATCQFDPFAGDASLLGGQAVSGAFGMARLSDEGVELIGPDLKKRFVSRLPGSTLSVGTVTVAVDGDLDGVALLGTDGYAGVYERGEERLRLQPRKAAARFGSGVAIDGEHWLVGSGEGVHVFTREGEELACVKIKRAKRPHHQPERFFARCGDHLVVSSTVIGEGAAVLLERHPKKHWAVSKEFPALTVSCAALTPTHLVLTQVPATEGPADVRPVHWTPLPVVIHTL